MFMTKSICKNCKDPIESKDCPTCGESLASHGRCMACHLEVEHNTIVPTASVHLCGNGWSGLNDADSDPDAYQPAWQSGN